MSHKKMETSLSKIFVFASPGASELELTSGFYRFVGPLGKFTLPLHVHGSRGLVAVSLPSSLFICIFP